MPPMPARAFDLSGGLSFGGFQAGTLPRLAISPHAGVAWTRKGNYLFTIHDVCSILPPNDHIEVGVYNESSINVGYATETAYYSAGPSLAFYNMMACGPRLCGRVVGVAAGGHAQTDLYFAGPLGISISANVNWIGGQSLVLNGGLAFMVVAGPVLRWRAKRKI
jgi:hypothetical protein